MPLQSELSALDDNQNILGQRDIIFGQIFLVRVRVRGCEVDAEMELSRLHFCHQVSSTEVI